MRKRPCLDCHELVTHPKARCEAHDKSGKHLYATARWRNARRWFLGLHPLCMECQAKGTTEIATVVDHMTPHREDGELFWDVENWAALCKPHHDRKTARQDGGFGR